MKIKLDSARLTTLPANSLQGIFGKEKARLLAQQKQTESGLKRSILLCRFIHDCGIYTSSANFVQFFWFHTAVARVKMKLRCRSWTAYPGDYFFCCLTRNVSDFLGRGSIVGDVESLINVSSAQFKIQAISPMTALMKTQSKFLR